MWKYISNSTLKREAASVAMLWLMAMASYIIFTGTEEIKAQVLNMFVLPIIGFVLGAFGADFVAKQTNIAGPPRDPNAPFPPPGPPPQ